MKWIVCLVVAVLMGILFQWVEVSPVAMVVGLYFMVFVFRWDTDERLSRLERRQ